MLDILIISRIVRGFCDSLQVTEVSTKCCQETGHSLNCVMLWGVYRVDKRTQRPLALLKIDNCVC